jgi:hypothetical protein
MLDLDHAAESRRRVSAARKCLEDDPATLDRAKTFLREAYDALGDTGPRALGVRAYAFVQVHDSVEHALLGIGDNSHSGARDAAIRALLCLERILAAAARPRPRERVLPFLGWWVLGVVYVGATAVMIITTDLMGPFGLKYHLLEAFGIAEAVFLLIVAVSALGTRWRRARRRRLAETHKMASQQMDTGGSGGTQPSAEPITDASPASRDYRVGRCKPLDGLLARLDYGPVVRALAQQATGCEEPLHRFWTVVEVGIGGIRRKRFVVATRAPVDYPSSPVREHRHG